MQAKTLGMGVTATVVYKRLASPIAEKHDKPYEQTLHWLRCRINFSLLRSSIMCLRGSRSHINHPYSFAKSNFMELACAEGRVIYSNLHYYVSHVGHVHSHLYGSGDRRFLSEFLSLYFTLGISKRRSQVFKEHLNVYLMR